MCSGSEAGSYLRRIDLVYHSTLGVRVIKKKKKQKDQGAPGRGRPKAFETSHVERRCSNLGPTQSRISPRIL